MGDVQAQHSRRVDAYLRLKQDSKKARREYWLESTDTESEASPRLRPHPMQQPSVEEIKLGSATRVRSIAQFVRLRQTDNIFNRLIPSTDSLSHKQQLHVAGNVNINTCTS